MRRNAVFITIKAAFACALGLGAFRGMERQGEWETLRGLPAVGRLGNTFSNKKTPRRGLFGISKTNRIPACRQGFPACIPGKGFRLLISSAAGLPACLRRPQAQSSPAALPGGVLVTLDIRRVAFGSPSPSADRSQSPKRRAGRRRSFPVPQGWRFFQCRRPHAPLRQPVIELGRERGPKTGFLRAKPLGGGRWEAEPPNGPPALKP